MDNEFILSQWQDVSKMLDRFDGMNKKVDEMYSAIVGNDKLGQDGLVVRLHRLEEKVSEMEEMITKTKGYIAGAAGVGTVLGFLISTFLKLIIK
jgi:hypothetical protein